jgi:hypothetical protein
MPVPQAGTHQFPDMEKGRDEGIEKALQLLMEK